MNVTLAATAACKGSIVVCILVDVLLDDKTSQSCTPTIFKTSVILPPAEPPFLSSHGRPPSSKGKSRPSSHSSTHSRQSSFGIGPEPHVAQTSFYRLQPLPAIGSSGRHVEDTGHCKSMKKARKSLLDGQVNGSNSSLPAEPSVDDANCVTLAIKLPDGTRFERRFRHTDLVADIIHAAQHHSTQLLPNCELFTSDVPRNY